MKVKADLVGNGAGVEHSPALGPAQLPRLLRQILVKNVAIGVCLTIPALPRCGIRHPMSSLSEGYTYHITATCVV